MGDQHTIGERVRLMRLAAGLGQVEFAERVGIATGSVSKIENGRTSVPDDLLGTIAGVLDCRADFLRTAPPVFPPSRPWLRAYADASKRAVDRQMADCSIAVDVIERMDLKTIPDTVPVFDGDPSDDGAIEQFALEVRAVAQLHEHDVVGNCIRAAERLGCIVLPMRHELGRHLGLSTRADLAPIICVSRPSTNPSHRVPGDRQRFTVAHELGHLALHSTQAPPQSAEEASLLERQAHLFAGAFLAPGDAMLEELAELGGRVTLRTLASIKERWGVAIKALVMRFRSLGVIDAEQARSLYKQISARGWNKDEPVSVGHEEAIWLSRAVHKRFGGVDAIASAASAVGIDRSYLDRWTDWSMVSADEPDGGIVQLVPRERVSISDRNLSATVTRLPARPAR